jgi:YD repeat-containing protein
MVAIVAGNGLGLFNTSNNILGSLGMLGQVALGQGSGRSLVNAATGNLLLQFQDESLSGRGADLLPVRTYNSQGTMSDGLGSGWMWDAEATVLFNGTTRNTAGTTVTRTTGDGHATTYAWNGSAYVSSEGSGAHDTIKFESTTSQWVWTEGTTRTVERYTDSVGTTPGRLVSRTDQSGNVVSYTFDTAGRVTSIVDAGSGQKMVLGYTTVAGATRLDHIDSYELTTDAAGHATGTLSTTATRQVQYTYDSQGRLSAVKTVLNPGESTPNFYITAYTYDGTSNRVATVVQSDGTNTVATFAAFTYEQAPNNGPWRIKTITDASGTQTLLYTASVNGRTKTLITDSLGQVWAYVYDSTTLQLVEIDSPNINGAPLVTQFGYDAGGNVITVTDPRGNVVTYGYDSQGNRIREQDSLGNVVTRTFDSANQVLTETQGDPTAGQTGTMTTRYVRDAQGRARFLITAEGRVTENRYDANGLLLRTIRYTASAYDTATLTATSVPTEAQMATWVSSSAVDKKLTELTRFEYDARGNISRRTDFASTDANGEGIPSDVGNVVTEYIDDGHGQLLKTIAIHGTQTAVQTTYTYDGLGRVISVTTGDGANKGTTTTLYDDAHRQIQIVNAANLSETRTFDPYGRLISATRSDLTPGSITPARSSKYIYDVDGRIQVVQDVLGKDSAGNDIIGPQRYSFYDAVGRLLYAVDATGAVTGFEYNQSGQVTAQTRYANRANTASWSVAKSALVVGPSGDVKPDANDRRTTFVYDSIGRQVTLTDGAGTVTTTTYDSASRVIQQRTGERVAQFFYDNDGLQVGVVDANGYLTEKKYDAAGRLVETVRYSHRSPLAVDHQPVWPPITSQTATANRAFSYTLPPAIDADGDDLAYNVVSKPDWVTFDNASLTLRGTPPAGTTSFDIVVSAGAKDGHGLTSSVTVHFDVGNSAPTWTTALPDATVATNTSGFSLQIPAASDNESAASTLVYSINSALLPPGLAFNAATRTISGTPTTAGTYAIAVRVTDPQGLFTEKTLVIQVTNRGLSWSGAPTGLTASRNSAFSVTIGAAVDPESQALSYRLVSGPSWLTLNGRTLSGTPPITNDALGTQAVVLEAQDPFGETVRLSFTVTVQNAAPTWASINQPAPIHAGTAFNYLPTGATDPEGQPLTFTATGLPPGFTINSQTGRITGSRLEVKDYAVTITATDPHGAAVSKSIVISQTNTAPTYSHGLPDKNVQFGVHTEWTMPADAFADPDGDPITGYFLQSSPEGFGYVPQPNGSVTLMMTSNAFVGSVFTVVIGATDSFGVAGYQSFTITIVPKNTAPTPPQPAPTPNPPGGPTGPRPPSIPQFAPIAAGSAASLAPLEPAPAPVFGPAVTQAEMPPAPPPRQLQGGSLAALGDVLSAWRPADTEALHSYNYYDGEGRMVGSVDERGFLTTTTYDTNGNVQLNTRYRKYLTETVGKTLAQLVGDAGEAQVTKIEFDALGRVLKTTGVDLTVTRNEYDSSGRLVRAVQADGTADARATRTVYDAFGDVVGKLGGVGDAWLTATSSSVATALAEYGTRYEYDALGHMTRTTGAKNNNGTSNASLMYYDDEGRLVYTVNARGEVTETQYDAFGGVAGTRAYLAAFATGQTGLTGGRVTQSIIDKVNLLRDDANDHSATYTYDKRGMVATSTDALGYVTTSTYTQYGQLDTQVRTILKAAGGDAASTVTSRYGYDLVGSVLVSIGDFGGANVSNRNVYDAYGRVMQSADSSGKVTKTSYLGGGRVIEITNPLDRKVRTEYDAVGRILFEFDASAMASGGKATEYHYDDVTRTVTVKTPEGVVVSNTRNVFGELATAVDGRGISTSYQYDKDGHSTSVTNDTLHISTVNTYDKKGRLETTTDGRGTVTRFTYDELNRVFTRQVDPSGLNLTTKYEFDGLGQQVKVTEASGTASQRVTRYSYDRDGRMFQVVTDSEGLGLATTYSFDGVGETVQVATGTLTSPNQSVVRYVFDKVGRRLKEIVAPSAVMGAGSSRSRDITTEYRYGANGLATRKIDANGQSTWFVYDDASELRYTINALGEVTQNDYDARGQVIQTRRYINRIPTGTVSGFGDVVDMASVSVSLKPSASDRRVYFVFDRDGNQRFVVQAEIGTSWSVSENRYDANGNLIETRRYNKVIDESDITAGDTAGSPGLSVDEVQAALVGAGYKDPTLGSKTDDASTLKDVERTRMAYDALNRLRFTVDALGGVSERIYDGVGNVVQTVLYATRPKLTDFSEDVVSNAVDRKNAANQAAHFTFDKASRLRFSVRVLNADTQGNATKQLVTEQKYDDLGHVVLGVGYATPLGAMADYSEKTVADALKALAVNPLDRREAMVYDVAGRQVYDVRVLAIDGTGKATAHVVTRREYDGLSRVIRATTYADKIGPLADYQLATLSSATGGSVAANPQNRSTQFVFDAVGRTHFTVAADGSFGETVYDALGQVIEQRQFDVRVPGNLPVTEASLVALRAARKVGDGVTRGVKTTYDTVGRTLTTTDALGNVSTNVYNGLGERTAAVDRNGKTWTYAYDRVGRTFDVVSPSVTARRADGTTWTGGLRTRYYYDAFGNTIKKVEGLATGDDRVTIYTYDKLDRQVSQTLPGWYDPTTGRVEAAANAANHRFQRILTAQFDALGNAVSTTVRTGENTYQYELKTYDNFGRVVHDIDALGNVTAFDYDTFGDQTKITRYSVPLSGNPANGAPASGGYWTVADIAAHQPQIAGDTHARTVTMVYDNLGRKTETHQPRVDYVELGPDAAFGNTYSSEATTRISYDVFGEVTQTSTAVGQNSWRNTYHYYDAVGRETRTVDALGYQTARSYDALGNLLEVVEFASPGTTSPGVNVPDPPAQGAKDRITDFVYDAMNRQVQVQRKGLTYVDSAGTLVTNGRDVATTTMTIGYDKLGHVISQADALGNVTTTEYDAIGQVTKVTEPARLAAAAGALDPFLTQNRVNASPVTTYVYNEFGQVVQQTHGPGVDSSGKAAAGATLTVTRNYDFAGNLIGVTDANGNTKTRTLDFAGRVTSELQQVIVTAQDLELANNSPAQLGTNQAPILPGFTQTLERRYTYDAAGRQIQVTDVYTDGNGVRQQSGKRSVYDAFGEITTDQRVWGLATTAANALNSVEIVTYTYDGAGHVTSQLAANGTTNYYYDQTGQVVWQQQIGDGESTVTNSPPRNSYTQYDIMGRAILQQLPMVPHDQEFFAARRIEQSFDRWGNVLSHSEGGAMFISSFQDEQHIENGARVTTTFEYDSSNHLIAETLPSVGVSYQNKYQFVTTAHAMRYDLLGRVVQSLDLVNGTVLRTRSRQYDAVGHVASETDATNHTTQYAYDGDGNRIGTRTPDGTVFVDSFDKNGNLLTHSVLRAPNGQKYVSGTTAASSASAVTLNQYRYDQANRRIFEADLTNYATPGSGFLDVGQPPTFIAKLITLTQYDERNLVRKVFQGDEALVNGAAAPMTGGVLSKITTYDQFGHTLTNTDANGNLQSWAYESAAYVAGRLKSQILNGLGIDGKPKQILTTYDYNDFGQVLRIAGKSTRTYGYDIDGSLQFVADSIPLEPTTNFHSKTREISTEYDYDLLGRVMTESSSSSVVTFDVDVVTGGGATTITSPEFSRTMSLYYDSLGRVTTVNVNGANSLLNSVTYQYDALGNRHLIIGTYMDDGTLTQSFKYYAYDAEGRMTIVDGAAASDGSVIAGSGGTAVAYDNAGRRVAATAPGEGGPITETYSYDDLGYLVRTQQSAAKWGSGLFDKELRTYDTTGRLISSASYGVHPVFEPAGFDTYLDRTMTYGYDLLGNIGSEHMVHAGSDDGFDLTYARDAAGNVLSYTVYQGTGDKSTSTSYNYTYELTSAGYRESTISSITRKVTGGQILSQGLTTNRYDGKGELIDQTVNGKVTDFVYDNDGHVISKHARADGGGQQNYFYAGGEEVAVVGSGTLRTAQFINNFTPVSGAYPAATPGTYVVSSNDSLASIAQAVYGDRALWYLIADANNVSFGPNDALPASEVGRTYHIPNVVTNVHGDSGAFGPYSRAGIIGSGTPSPLPLPGPTCRTQTSQALASVVIAAIAVVVSAYTGGLAAGVFAELGAGSVLAGFAGGAVGGAAAGTFTQVSGWELGLNDVSGTQILGSTVGGALGGAADALGAAGRIAGGSGGSALGSLGSGLSATSGVLGGIAANAIVNGDFDSRSLLDLVFQGGTNTLLGGALSAIDTDHFKWGSGIAQLALSSVNPNSGWLFDDRSRNWASIAQRAATAFGTVAIGGVVAATLTPAQEQEQPAPVWVPDETGDFELQGASVTESDGDRIVDTIERDPAPPPDYQILYVTSTDRGPEDVVARAGLPGKYGEYVAEVINHTKGENVQVGQRWIVPNIADIDDATADMVRTEAYVRQQHKADIREFDKLAQESAVKYAQQHAEAAANAKALDLGEPLPEDAIANIALMGTAMINKVISNPDVGKWVTVNISTNDRGIRSQSVAYHQIGTTPVLDVDWHAGDVINRQVIVPSSSEVSNGLGLSDFKTWERWQADNSSMDPKTQEATFRIYKNMADQATDYANYRMDNAAAIGTAIAHYTLEAITIPARFTNPVGFYLGVYVGKDVGAVVEHVTGNDFAGMLTANLVGGYVGGKAEGREVDLGGMLRESMRSGGGGGGGPTIIRATRTGQSDEATGRIDAKAVPVPISEQPTVPNAAVSTEMENAPTAPMRAAIPKEIAEAPTTPIEIVKPAPRTASGEIDRPGVTLPEQVPDDTASLPINQRGNDPSRPIKSSTILDYIRNRADNTNATRATLGKWEPRPGARINFEPDGDSGGWILSPKPGEQASPDVNVNFADLYEIKTPDGANYRVATPRNGSARAVRQAATVTYHEITHTLQDFSEGYNLKHELAAYEAQRDVYYESVPDTAYEIRQRVIDPAYRRVQAPPNWWDDGHPPVPDVDVWIPPW